MRIAVFGGSFNPRMMRVLFEGHPLDTFDWRVERDADKGNSLVVEWIAVRPQVIVRLIPPQFREPSPFLCAYAVHEIEELSKAGPEQQETPLPNSDVHLYPNRNDPVRPSTSKGASQ